jgi:hypothetical protein
MRAALDAVFHLLRTGCTDLGVRGTAIEDILPALAERERTGQ